MLCPEHRIMERVSLEKMISRRKWKQSVVFTYFKSENLWAVCLGWGGGGRNFSWRVVI